MDDRYWLDSLKAGDTTMIQERHGNGYSMSKVKRVTKNRIILSYKNMVQDREYEVSFARTTGRETGDRYYAQYIRQPTPERLEEYKLIQLKLKVKRLLNKIVVPNDIPSLNAMIAVLETLVKTSGNEEENNERVR